ncbi:MAG: hypothetical protein ABIO36_04530 [Pyrinomonadaceae bacterium]
MDLSLVEKIADAVLYEGYMLYPYRASSVKNQQRFNWGALAPKAYSDAQKGTEAWEMRTECLIVGDRNTELNVKVRFLQLTNREIGKIAESDGELPADFERVQSLDIDGRLYQAWQEAVEREVIVPVSSPGNPDVEFPFNFPETSDIERIFDADGSVAGAIIRTQREITGEVRLSIDTSVGSGLSKVTVLIRNTTPFDDAELSNREVALLSSVVSTHTILSVSGGEFVSLLEPPDEFAEAAANCDNKGCYPVLAGDDGRRDRVLSSPIILYDYPEIAPESAGELFDSAEIDEILTLRIMTLTDEEKREMRSVDGRARKILERIEMMPEEQLLKMHGALRGLNESKKANYG